MTDNAFYLVGEELARRSGLIGQRYIIKDGRFVLDKKDLTRIQLTAEEFVKGLDAERVSAEKAKTLIARNGFKMEERK